MTETAPLYGLFTPAPSLEDRDLYLEWCELYGTCEEGYNLAETILDMARHCRCTPDGKPLLQGHIGFTNSLWRSLAHGMADRMGAWSPDLIADLRSITDPNVPTFAQYERTHP